MKRVKCKSGIEGWQFRLQENYDDFNHFKSYAKVFSIHKRLGFRSMKSAWETNPIIRGSVIPEDLERIYSNVYTNGTIQDNCLLIYSDFKCKKLVCKFPTHYSNCPTKKTKFITLNCVKWKLKWV